MTARAGSERGWRVPRAGGNTPDMPLSHTLGLGEVKPGAQGGFGR